MIDHTVAQVEQAERFYISRGYPHIKITLAERTLEFYQVPQSINPDLPDFVLRHSNEATKEHVMGICNTVPGELQPYFILQEYVEFIEKGINCPNRVIEAEEIVISVIPQELKKDYLRRRIDLFRKELELDRKQPKEYALGKGGTEEFERNLRFLEKELANCE